jgi:hypothetical protein
MTTETTTTCQTDAKAAAGEEVTEQEWTRWAMWGCTCNDNGEAMEWMNRVTR